MNYYKKYLKYKEKYIREKNMQNVQMGGAGLKIISWNILNADPSVIKMLFSTRKNTVKSILNVDDSVINRIVDNLSLVESERSLYRYAAIITLLQTWLSENTIICLQEVNSYMVKRLNEAFSDKYNITVTNVNDYVVYGKQIDKDEHRVIILPEGVELLETGTLIIERSTLFKKDAQYVYIKRNDQKILIINVHLYWKLTSSDLEELVIHPINQLLIRLRPDKTIIAGDYNKNDANINEFFIKKLERSTLLTNDAILYTSFNTDSTVEKDLDVVDHFVIINDTSTVNVALDNKIMYNIETYLNFLKPRHIALFTGTKLHDEPALVKYLAREFNDDLTIGGYISDHLPIIAEI